MDDAQRLLVSLEGRFSQYEKNFDRAMRKTDSNFRAMEKRAKVAADKMDSVMSSALKGLGTGMVTAIAGIGFQEIVQRAADTAKSIAKIGDEAKRAGLSSKAFQELGYVASQYRIEVDSLVDGMKELNLRADEWITTGGGSAAEAFQRLGYNATDLRAKLADPSALLAEIIERVRTLDRAAQIRIFDEIFGGTGGEKFVQLIDRGADSIRKTVKEARDLGLVLDDEVIAKADEIDRKFDQIATTVSTKLKSAVVTVVSEMANMSKTLNGTQEQAVALAGNRLLSTYAAIEETKAKLHDLNLDKAASPDDITIDLNIQRAEEDLKLLEEQALEIRDIMDRYQGWPGPDIKDTGDKSGETKPKVEGLNDALNDSNKAANNAASGLKSYSEAIRALTNEVPELASELARLDARNRVEGAYRAALSKSSSVQEALDANDLRREAYTALSVKDAIDNPAVTLAPRLAPGKSMESLTGMDSGFSQNLAKMFASAPENVRNSTSIYSGYRSIERQQQLWAEALAKYGSPEAARKWVAPPGNSQHNKGFAADLRFGDDSAREWFHANAEKFGLSFPLSNENWHIEDADARQNFNAEQYQQRSAAMTEQASAYQQIITNAQQHIQTQATERQALSMTEQAAAKFRLEQQMLAEAQRAGITLTDAQRAEISKLAAGMAQADTGVQQYVASQQEAAQVSRFFGEQAVDSLTGLITGTMTAQQAMQNLTSAIVRAALQAAILGEGPFASLLGKSSTSTSAPSTKGIGGLLGSFLGLADGGHVRGPGTGTSDSIPARLSNGEFVVNAKATRANRVLLEKINAGQTLALAGGGYVGNAPAVRGQDVKTATGNAAPQISINAPVTVNASGGTPEANADLAKRVSKEMEATMRGVVTSEIVRQMRPGNMLSGRR